MQAKKSSVTGIALVVAMGGFLMGFDASVISGVIKFIEPEFQLLCNFTSNNCEYILTKLEQKKKKN